MTKSLSPAAIVVIASNTMNGPGLTTLPSMANLAGKLFFSILVILAAMVASFVVKRLCHLMWTSHQEKGKDSQAPHHTQEDQEERELDNLFLLEQEDQEGVPDTPSLHRSTRSSSEPMIVLLPTVPPPSSTSIHPKQSLSDPRPSLEEADIVALSEKLFSQKKLAAWAMVGCALSLALAQMMVCAAVADSMLVAAVGQSCALAPKVVCTSHLSIKPFQSDELPSSVLSIGLVLASMITVSLAAVDLDAMVTSQYVLFACLLVSCIRFSCTLHEMGNINTADGFATAPAPKYIGSHPFDAVGPILFNFAFVVTAPPLICGTTSAERASWSLVGACFLMATLYVMVGSAGANAAANQPLDNNLLSLVFHGRDANTLNFWDIVAAAMFGLSQLASIPVYCELARATLLTHLEFSNRRAVFVASNVGPWFIVAGAYNSALFEAFVEWSSLLLLGFANFSIPLILDHVFSQRLDTMERVKLHPREGNFCPGRVAWAMALITAGIAAVIVQRVTGMLLVTEIVFLATVVMILLRSKIQNDPLVISSSATLAEWMRVVN